jgi:hypothetical protein
MRSAIRISFSLCGLMSEAYEVASQVFHPSEKGLRILRAEGASLAKRRFLVHGNAA